MPQDIEQGVQQGIEQGARESFIKGIFAVDSSDFIIAIITCILTVTATFLVAKYKKKKKVKFNDIKYLAAVARVPRSTISFRIVNTGEVPIEFVELIINNKQVDIEVRPPIGQNDFPFIVEPGRSKYIHFELWNLMNPEKLPKGFSKIGVKTSDGKQFWLKDKDLIHTIKNDISQYTNRINNTFKKFRINGDFKTVKSMMIDLIKDMDDIQWDLDRIIQEVEKLFNRLEIHRIIIATEIPNEPELIYWDFINHPTNAIGIRGKDAQEALEDELQEKFRDVVLSAYKKLQEDGKMDMDPNEDEYLQEIDGVLYKLPRYDFGDLFKELEIYNSSTYTRDRNEILLQFGQILLIKEYHSSAIKCFEKIIESNSKLLIPPQAYQYLARSLWRGLYYVNSDCERQRIIDLYQKYIDTCNTDERYIGYFSLGQFYRQIGDNETALKNLNMCKKENPDFPEVYESIAFVHQRNGNRLLEKQNREKYEELKKAHDQ